MKALEVKVRRHHVLAEQVKLLSGGEKHMEIWNRIIGTESPQGMVAHFLVTKENAAIPYIYKHNGKQAALLR
jgi:hypothetical protein